MKSWKGGLIFGVLLTTFALLLVFGVNISGNVVISSITGLDNCSDAAIVALWDDVFEESSAGITVIKDAYADGLCETYFAFKTNVNGEVWYMPVEIRNDDGTIEKRVFGVYSNVTDAFLAEVNAATTYLDGSGLWMDLMDIERGNSQNWTIENVAAAEAEVDARLKIDDPALQYNEGEDVSGWRYLSEETFEVGDVSEKIGRSINENASILVASYTYIDSSDYDIPSAILTSDIDDYTFERNSSLNYAFSAGDHFDSSGGYDNIGVEFKVIIIDANNTNGEYISGSVASEIVGFLPKVGFVGSREFKLGAYREDTGALLNASNVFNVTIVEDLNYAPVKINEIGAISVPRDGGANVFLSSYFEDPDGDEMDYRVTGATNLNITFREDLMTVRLEDDFSGYVMIRVYADDGDIEVRSDAVYVFEEGVNFSIQNITGDNLLLLINDSGNETNSSFNSSGSVGNDEVENGWMLWVIIISVFVLVLIIFFVWFFAFRNKVAPGVVANTQPSPAVNNYLASLDLPEK